MADQMSLRDAARPHPPGHKKATREGPEDHIDWYGGCRCWCAPCLTTNDRGNHLCTCPQCNHRCGLEHLPARPSNAEETTTA